MQMKNTTSNFIHSNIIILKNQEQFKHIYNTRTRTYGGKIQITKYFTYLRVCDDTIFK